MIEQSWEMRKQDTMSTELKSVLVFGATGVIGQYIITSLIKAETCFERLAIFTSPSTVDKKAKQVGALKEKGVEIIVGDFTNKEDVLKAYAGQSLVSCDIFLWTLEKDY